MPQQRKNENLFDLFSGFADLVGQRLVLADELAKTKEEETYKRDVDRQEFALDREYKRAQIQKLQEVKPEKPLVPSNAYEMDYYLRQQGLSEKDILSRIAGLQGVIKPESEQGIPAGVLTETTKQFYESRRPDEYSPPPPLTGTDRFGVQHNAPDSLMQILSGLTGRRPMDTSGVQPQGDKFDLQAKSVRRDQAVQLAMKDPKFREMTPQEQEEFLQWLEVNKISQDAEKPELKTTTGLKQRDSRIDQSITEAMQLTGVDESWRPYLKSLAIAESSGDTAAVNTWDINAKRGTPSKGLFQVIDPTFNKHKMKGFDNIYDPTSNTVAAIRYIKQRYGHPSNVNYSGGGY